jgi:transcription elongation GreA/GreB family factor
VNASERRVLIQRVRATLQREADAMLAAATSARDAATHEEARPENDKDTRAIEAGYLAGAQAERVRELRDAVAALDAMPCRDAGEGEPVALGSLIRVEANERGATRTWCYLMAPEGGGTRVEWNGESVSVITPASPLGRALLGRRRGDVVEVATDRGEGECELLAVE